MAKSPYKPMGQKSGFTQLATAKMFTEPTATNGLAFFNKQGFDIKLNHGATGVTEQFKGLPVTGFTPGANEAVGGGLLFQQRLRLMFVELVQQGMSHKDAAKHIQKSTGFHARTGQKISAKVSFTKEKKITYAGQYATTKHYHAKLGKHRPTRRPGSFPATPAGLK